MDIARHGIVATIIATMCGTMASAQEETILACQYTVSSGFQWQENRWVQGEFEPRAPFFMRIRDGRIDPESLGILYLGSKDGCVKSPRPNGLETCANSNGNAVHFSYETLTGAATSMFGASQGVVDQKDSVIVTMFVCEEM